MTVVALVLRRIPGRPPSPWLPLRVGCSDHCSTALFHDDQHAVYVCACLLPVIGRTGSGKSSLMLSMLRMYPFPIGPGTGTPGSPLVTTPPVGTPQLHSVPSTGSDTPIPADAEGVFLDGVPVASLPLPVLRANVRAMLQDPVLFSGSVRDNVCGPDSSHSDDEIREMLTGLGLKPLLDKLPEVCVCRHATVAVL